MCAERGLPECCERLGNVYYTGSPLLQKDLHMALHWSVIPAWPSPPPSPSPAIMAVSHTAGQLFSAACPNAAVPHVCRLLRPPRVPLPRAP